MTSEPTSLSLQDMLKVDKYRLQEVPQGYWDFAHREGNIYQSKPWLSLLASMGKEIDVIVVTENGQFVGGAGILLNHKIFNFSYSACVSMGPIVNDPKMILSVLNGISNLLKFSCLSFNVSIWPIYAQNLVDFLDRSSWSVQEFEVLHWDISAPMDSIWKELPKGKKAAINRARREGVIIEEIETPSQVEQFYKLHVMSMTRAEFKQPSSLFFYKSLLEKLKPLNLATGFLALHPQNKKPIAAVFLLLGMTNIATYLQVGHDYEYRNLGATDLLMWHCLEFLKLKKYVTFDLVGLPKGNSSRAEGIRHFKTAWAGIYGRRCPLYVLVHSNFSVFTRITRKVVLLWKNLINSIMKIIINKANG